MSCWPFRQPRRVAATVGIVLLGVAWCGCSSRDLDTVYGKRRGAQGGASVNGVGVLAGMFEEAGHKVTTRHYLSPNIRNHDVIVWAPDEAAPLRDQRQQQFFDNWLRTGANRTLVFIGRDYDAATSYWEQVQATAPPDQAVEVLRRSAQARARRAQLGRDAAESTNLPWFRLLRDRPPRLVGGRDSGHPEFGGIWAESDDLDPRQLELPLEARVEPLAVGSPDDFGGPLQHEVWLSSGDDVIVRRVIRDGWRGGQVIAVANGSFLLNLPLVEPEHRKLAGKLIAACGPPGRPVVFLESGFGGPQVYEKEPGEAGLTGFEALTVWPLGAILLHIVALGLLYLFSRTAIFGRPQELAPDAVSDFGRHIQALGELLSRTQDHATAAQKLAYYHEKVRRESGTQPGGSADKRR